ncbi:MAG: hypothetical protein JRN20_13955 [Nitrososphaerota archaeon]|nr:hypothetical protein [Nitrososphaerota archaeon]
MRSKSALSLGVVVLVVLLVTFLIAIASFGLYLQRTLYPTINTTYAPNTVSPGPPNPSFIPSIQCTNTTTPQRPPSTTTFTCFASSAS